MPDLDKDKHAARCRHPAGLDLAAICSRSRRKTWFDRIVVARPAVADAVTVFGLFVPCVPALGIAWLVLDLRDIDHMYRDVFRCLWCVICFEVVEGVSRLV